MDRFIQALPGEKLLPKLVQRVIPETVCPKELLKIKRIHLDDLDTPDRDGRTLRQCHTQQ